MSSTKVKPFFNIALVSVLLDKLSRYWCIGIIFVFYIAIFIFLHGKVLFTPDFGSSDAFHLNFAGKYYLAETLRHNELPHWTWLFSGGYPLLAEGQIGALHLINIVLLKFLPFSLTYNLLYIIPLLLFTLGFYGLFREYKLSPLLALLLSLNVSLCGGLMFQLTHLNYIQTVAYFPLILLSAHKFIKTYSLRYLIFIPFLISQMFFAGHLQGAFIVMMTIGLSLGGQIRLLSVIGKKQKIYLLSLLFISFLAGALLAFPQLLPTLQLSKYSVRSGVLDYSTVTQFPFTIKSLVNFFTPFIFGNPKYGTYPLFLERWGIFWENTPYVGEFFIFFVICIIFIAAVKKNKILKEKNVVYLIGLLFFFILLGLGKNSPLYFVYNFPPFAFFRVSSRFMISVVFILYMVVALFLRSLEEKNQRAKKWSVFLLTLNFFILFYVTARYHLFVNFNDVVKPPTTAAIINHQGYKTLLAEQAWNKFFLKNGWATSTEEKNYAFLKEALYPNLNLVYSAQTVSPNTAGLQLRRNALFESLLFEDITTKDNAIESVPNRVTAAYTYLGIQYFIAAWPIRDTRFHLVKKISNTHTTVYVYNNPFIQKSPFFIVPQSVSRIEFLHDFVSAYKNEEDFSKNAYAEEIEVSQKNTDSKAEIKNIEINPTKVNATITARAKTFVVAKINNYPEWRLFINHKEERLYKTNITSTGFFVPAGNSLVQLVFTNSAFYRGVYIASVSAGIYIGFLILLIKLKLAQRFGLLPLKSF